MDETDGSRHSWYRPTALANELKRKSFSEIPVPSAAERRNSEIRELRPSSLPDFLVRRGGDSPLYPKQSSDVVISNGVKVATVHLHDVFVEVEAFEIPTLAGAALLQQAVDAELFGARLNRLLINAVEMSIAPKEVNDYMWRWAHAHSRIKKIAVVNQSQVMRVAVRMRAVASGQRLAAFEQRTQAVTWLRTP